MSDPTLNQDEIDALLADVQDPTEGPVESGAGDIEPVMEDASIDSIDSVDADDLLGDFDSAGDVSAEPVEAAADTDMDMDFGGDDLASMLDETPADDASVDDIPEDTAEPAKAPAGSESSIDMGDFQSKNIEALLDVPLEVVVELGRSEMAIQKVLDLGPGSVVELNRLAGEPINVLVNGKLVARGEVVVVDENFGIKITNIISPMERLTQLN
ncbi:MAG TPA: flagellar motor switch protein FliN [bacterium]|nr:flagellar motor switch protein FliN [bacterium]